MNKISEDTVEGSVRLLEEEIGIQEGFLESLKNENDWSFVIKLHALLEAAVSHLLCKALNHDELSNVFSFVELSNIRSGKIAFAESLGLLDKQDIRFIHSLSELRNKLVHDISNVEFNLKDYVQNLSSSNFKNFVKKMDGFSKDGSKVENGSNVSVEDLFKSKPKTAIWYSAMVTIGIIYQQKEIASSKRKIEIYKEAFKSLKQENLTNRCSGRLRRR